jgi:chromosome segregation ATPase
MVNNMAENNVKFECIYHIDHENRIRKNEEDIKELDDRITDTEKTVAVFDVELREAIKNMSKLPEAIDKLTNSNIELHGKIDRTCNVVDSLKKDFESYKNENNETIKTVKEEAEEANDKFKVDIWKDFIKPNLKWIITILFAVGYIVYTQVK